MTGWLVRRLRPFRLGDRATTAVEFALILPLLLLLTAGVMEAGLVLMADAQLEIAAHDAARYGMVSSSMAAGTRDAAVQAIVYDHMLPWVPDRSAINISTLHYTSFANVGQPEPVNSALHPDGTCSGSCVACTGTTIVAGCDYVDVNGNGKWDADEGASGAGGSGDIVVYDITVKRSGFTGILSLAGISQLTFNRSLVIQNE